MLCFGTIRRCPSLVHGQAIVSFTSPNGQFQCPDIELFSVIGAAAAQLGVFWTSYAGPDVTQSLWLPTIFNQIVVFLSFLADCLPYLRPLMESLKSGIVRVPEDVDESRSFARGGSRIN